MGGMSLHDGPWGVCARVRLGRDIIASHGDRFILRAVGRPMTLGGGIVLNPHPTRRFSQEIIEGLMDGQQARRVEALVKDAGLHGITKRRIEAVFAADPNQAAKALETLMSSQALIRFDATSEAFVHRLHMERLTALLAENVGAYHAANPSSPGMPKEHLRQAVRGGVDPRLFHKALTDLVKKGVLVESGPLVAKAGFRPSLDGDRLAAAGRLASLVEKAGFEPPKAAELAEAMGIPEQDAREILGFLCRQGTLVRINDDLHLSKKAEESLKTLVKSHIEKHGALTPLDMKAIAGVSRKYAIPYLEYLDRIHFTMRVGDARKLAAVSKD